MQTIKSAIGNNSVITIASIMVTNNSFSIFREKPFVFFMLAVPPCITLIGYFYGNFTGRYPTRLDLIGMAAGLYLS
jgi:hypothetical protein